MAIVAMNTGITGGNNIKSSSKPSSSGNSFLSAAVNSALAAANYQFPNAAAQAAYEMMQVPAGRAPLFPVSQSARENYSTSYKYDNNPDYANAIDHPWEAITGQLTGTGTAEAVNQTATTGTNTAGNSITTPTSNSTYVGNGQTLDIPDYLWADLAKYYGMDAVTAYQEALSNTSYQRAVKDLQAAGLNPLLAVQGLSGSGGVYSAQAAGSGVSYGGSSGKGAHQWYSIFSNLGGAIGGLVGGNTVGYRIGNSIGTVIGNVLDGQYK